MKTREPGGVPPSREVQARFDEVFLTGFRALEDGRHGDALDAFQRAERIDPTDARAPHGQGEVYEKLLFHEQAIEAYRRALALDPSFSESAKNLVKLHYEAGDQDAALQLLADLERRRPNDPFVWAERSLHALRNGDASKAIVWLEKYNAAEGRQAWGTAQLGRAHELAGDLVRAETLYRAAIEIDPRFSMAHYWLGQLLAELGRDDESSLVLEAYRRLRHLETLCHQLRMSLLRDPKDVASLVELARARAALGSIDEARKLIDRARGIAPSDPRVLRADAALRSAAQTGPHTSAPDSSER
jgi:tetratricopeptide (TPR) repeat protein